jgi:multiple sugar transport system substrate-binding protein
MLYMAQAGYQPSDILERASSFEEQTGITVNLWFVEYEDQYNLIIESSKKPTADYDVILVDLIWTADFAERSIIDPIPAHLVETVRQGIIPEIYSAFSYDARIWAVPFLANFQLFYTNMELLHQAGFLHPPSTLEELVDMATRAKQMGLIEYPLFDSLRKQEVLVCEFVWLVGAFGGIWWTRPEGSTSTRKRAGTPSSSWSACWTKNF